MLLFELFLDDHDTANDKDAGPGDLVQKLRQACIDALMPLAAQGLPYVTIQAIIDKLKQQHAGIDVDRALIMQVLDPEQVKMVTKIEGDKVFFKMPDDQDRKVDDQQKQKDQQHVHNKAADQAKKAATGKGPLG